MARILQALDGERLLAARCLFGGGTAIALAYGEFRESRDIDFLVSDLDGYRRLRQDLTGVAGLAAITRPGARLHALREVRADQYGVRTLVAADAGNDAGIKFEIVLEGRIVIEPPRAQDLICGVATLTPLDMATSKLLANADRWRDDSVLSRDIIDLAMMRPGRDLLRRALAKARGAYGDSVEEALLKAIENLRAQPHRLDHCMQAMGIGTVPKAVLWARIKALAPRRRKQ